MNEKNEIYKNTNIVINDNLISYIGNVLDEHYDEVYDAEDKIVIPGLINTHVHLSQQLGRGLADDVDLLTWLQDRIWPYESSLSPEDNYLSSLACCIELVKSGVTTFLEAGGQHVESMVDAVTKAGIRGCLSKSVTDSGKGLPASFIETVDDTLKYQEELYNKFNGVASGRIKIWLGLRTIFSNTDELIIKTKELADKLGTGIHMHIAEIKDEIEYAKATRGTSTVEHLANIGVLGSNLLAVHTVWLTDEEVDLIKKYDVKVSHNPAAAMKVVVGFTKVTEMIEKGIPVAIGTDGAPSNNRMDLMRDMYLTGLIHKGRTLDAKSVDAYEVLKMATMNGARCALMQDEIGSLEVGKKADLVVLDLKDIATLPIYDFIGNIVYSSTSRNVESTMCDGKWVYKHKKILFEDEEEILDRIKEKSKLIAESLNISLENKYNII